MGEARYGRNNPWRTFESSILEADDLTVYEKMVYVVISSHATSNNQKSWPALKTIAKKGSMSIRKAQQALRVLEEKNLVRTVERFKMVKGKSGIKVTNDSNLYVIFPYSDPFNPETEWIDSEGNVHPLHDMHPVGEQDAPGGMNDMHPGDAQDAPTPLHDMRTNKTIINKTIEQDHLEQDQQQEDDVVAVKFLLKSSFKMNQNLADKDVKFLISFAKEHDRDLTEVIVNTKSVFKGKKIKNVIGALRHEITHGWSTPTSSEEKKLPKTIAKEIDEQKLTDEELQGTYEDIQATIKFLRGTEKQVLADKH